MKLTDKQIAEIADLLDMGQVCYFHRLTGEIKHHTDPDSLFYDPDQWEDIISAVKKDRDNFVRFDPMGSRESYQTMVDFAHSIQDLTISDKLLKILSQSKPFQKFKHQIQLLQYTDDWHQFKQKAMIDWVRQQVEE